MDNISLKLLGKIRNSIDLW